MTPATGHLGRSPEGRTWTFRRRHVVTVVAVVVLAISIGLVSQQSKIKDLTSKNESLAARKAEVTRERNTTRHALDAVQQELAGAAVFAATCTPCHFRDGGGGIGPHLFGGAVVAHLSEAQEIAKVTNGGVRMPAFGGRLTPEQIQQVVEYTRTH